MRSEFQDVFKDAYDHWVDDACSQRYYASRNLALQVWRHQQSKVDELHKISVALNTETIRQREQVAYYLSKNAELQKRVDAAFRVLSQLNALDDEAHKRWKREACMFSQGESNAYEHAVRLLEQALKGGSDEAK